MNRAKEITNRRRRRKMRTRSKIFGTHNKPRLTLFRSNKNIYAQLIDDEEGRTLASAFTKKISEKSGNKTEQAEQAGKTLAEKAQKLGIKRAFFDKGHYKYHGRIKALAEGARKAGLKI